ncbi:uncharacterized protein B0H64DRAFT_391414 [Chaetomium fimeti]|uniref:Uncharacterized protein n=1 Tax=Chaetomium fimeti TaxID=1854472 RepID=A0AAE0HIH4_9PEZI|nr:hypothetical protein B0H64DRAFT_391414 [Chaetomium fimeti]
MAILLIPVRETAIIDQLSSRRFVQLNSEHPPNLIIPPHPASPGRYVGHQPATLFHRKNIDQLADDFTRNSGHVYPSARNRMVRSEIWINDWPVYGSIWIPCRKVLDQLLTQLGRYSISMVFDWDTLDQNQRESNVSGIELSSLNDLAPRQDTTETVFYDGESLPESLYQTYKSVPEIGFRRHGPALGFSGSCFWGNVSVMSVAKDMSVRCYTVTDTGLMQTFQSSSPNPEKEISTRCIQVGQGWAGSRNHHGQFYINETKPLTNETSDTVSVDFYSLSRIVFLNSTTRNCGIPMVDGRSNPPCDWNALFSESPSPGHRAASLNQQVVEYSYRNGSVDADGSQFNPHSHVYSTAWCNSASHLGFGTYELAATRRLINATGDARLTIETEPEPAEPVYIHPDWVLASWEVSHSVTVPVDSNNPAATLVLNALRQVFSYRNAPMKDLWGLFSIHAIIMISALGIIDYDELPLNDADPESTSTNRILDNFITSEILCRRRT